LSTKWLEKFKVAIIEKDFEKLEILLDEMPEIKKIEELKNTVALINEAKKLISEEQKLLRDSMAKVKKSKHFLTNYVEEVKFSESV